MDPQEIAMLQRVRDLTEEYGMLPPGCRVLCAVSGGADSVCLLHLLHTMAEQAGFSLFAAHFDHRLRGEESTRDAAFVENLCRDWGIPFTLGSGNVADEARRRRKGIEETARSMRYTFLEETARALDCDRVATAHNADDNAETVLLHLVRGAALQGLTGIAPRRGPLIRPLLTVSRREIEGYLAGHGLPHVEDSSNADDTYTRNLLRHQVMPLLEQINPQFTRRLAGTTRALACDQRCLNDLAAQRAGQARQESGALVLDAGLIASAPDAVAPRVVRLLLERMEGGSDGCTAAHLRAVTGLARGSDPSAQVSLPGGRVVRRVYGELWFCPGPSGGSFAPTPLNTDGETWPEGTLYGCRCRRTVCPTDPPPGVCYFPAFQGLPLLRPRRTGDAIRLPGRESRTLKKLLIDRRIPRLDRERLPVLCDDGGLLALAGFGPDSSRTARPGEEAYEIQFIHISERKET